MKKVVVTGANGFIGRCLVGQLAAAGHQAVALSRDEWRLGLPLPDRCKDADAVVHLACAALKAARGRKAAAALDIDGTRLLLEQQRSLREAGAGGRLVFVSSQSAQAGAQNVYGQSKWEIEKLIDREGEFIVRPGLVYDRAGGSVFGIFETLASLPLVPIFSSRPCIQPIEVNELALGLVRLATTRAQARRVYELGAVTPMTLEEMVRAVARRSGKRPPACVPFPSGLVRFAASAADRALGLSPSILERVDGLIALQPMDTRPSLDDLELSLADFSDRDS
jgi:nucleoside-diphosphate-sugar epimerase